MAIDGKIIMIAHRIFEGKKVIDLEPPLMKRESKFPAVAKVGERCDWQSGDENGNENRRNAPEKNEVTVRGLETQL